MRISRIAAVAGLALLIAGSSAQARSRPAGKIVDRWGPSVFAVEYRLRPEVMPRGGQTDDEVRRTVAVLVRGDGLLVIPADHVPEPDAGPREKVPVDLRVLLPDGEEVPAELMGVHRGLNLAFIETDPARLGGAEPVDFSGAEGPGVGQPILVLSPLPRDLGGAVAYRRNEVVAVLDDPAGFALLDRPIEDLEIGGLAVAEDGTPLGIIGEKLLRGETPPHRPFGYLRLFGSTQQGPAVGYPGVLPGPILVGLAAAPPPLEQRRVRGRGWLGVSMQPLTEDLAEYWDLDGDGGVIIGAVVDGSPAEQAGLLRGDVIVALDGLPLPVRSSAEMAEVRRRIQRAGPGSEMEITVWRDGEQRSTRVLLGASPANLATAERFESETFGVTVRELTYDMRLRLNLPEEVQGVVVEDVVRGGWAALAGLHPGDLVLRVDGREPMTLEAFREALTDAESEQAPEIQMLLQRQFRTFFLTVATEWKR